MIKIKIQSIFNCLQKKGERKILRWQCYMIAFFLSKYEVGFLDRLIPVIQREKNTKFPIKKKSYTVLNIQTISTNICTNTGEQVLLCFQVVIFHKWTSVRWLESDVCGFVKVSYLPTFPQKSLNWTQGLNPHRDHTSAMS